MILPESLCLWNRVLLTEGCLDKFEPLQVHTLVFSSHEKAFLSGGRLFQPVVACDFWLYNLPTIQSNLFFYFFIFCMYFCKYGQRKMR